VKTRCESSTERISESFLRIRVRRTVFNGFDLGEAGAAMIKARHPLPFAASVDVDDGDAGKIVALAEL
jgi:hypothetical protein